MADLKDSAQKVLDLAGITINGDKPYDIQVHNDKFYQRVLAGGSVALGESYVEGWWDAKQLDEFFTRILRADLGSKVKDDKKLALRLLQAKFLNFQSQKHAFDNGQAHYDRGNDLYEAMLDKKMVYTCAYWKDAKNLDEAQIAKLDLVCRKVGLKKGQRILDIGCGWGSFAKYAAENYGVEVVGITVSKEQASLAKENCKGLPVEIRLQDYRDLNEQFDHIISLGMFEHVGHKNYREYMEVVRKCLKPGGLFLLHTIGGIKSVTVTDPWIDKYIFPNSLIPSVTQIAEAAEGLFIAEDLHNIGLDYDKTLMAWNENFVKNAEKLKTAYDNKFKRMWSYYLLSCAGSFRARKNQLWQIVFARDDAINEYISMR